MRPVDPKPLPLPLPCLAALGDLVRAPHSYSGPVFPKHVQSLDGRL